MISTGTLTAILLDLHKNCRSGILRIEKKAEKKQLVLVQGALAYAESNRPEEHLAHVMVGKNLLPAQKMAAITALMKQGKSSEEALLEIPNIRTDDVAQGKRSQAIAILASVWKWSECDLHFYAGENLLRYRINLSLSLPELLVHAARHAAAHHCIRLPQDWAQEQVSTTKVLAARGAELPLNSGEAAVLSALQEPLRTADLLARIPANAGGPVAGGPDGGKPMDLLACLAALGLIIFQKPEALPDSLAEDLESDPHLQRLDDLVTRLGAATHYEILSVPAKADAETIQAAYHELARQFHPDRFQSQKYTPEIHQKAQRAFAAINEAYYTLKHPDARAAYNASLLAPSGQAEAGSKSKTAARAEDEKTLESLYQAGRACLVKGDFEKAVERLRGCVWMRPETARYHHYLGVAQAHIPKLRKEAEQNLLKALELDAMCADSHLELARLYIKVQLPRKAERHLQQLLHWDPAHREAQKLLEELAKFPR